MREALTLPEVAARLKVKREWFYRHWRKLQREHRFPGPMPGFGEHRWDPRAIELWQDAQLRAQGLLPAAPAAAPPAAAALPPHAPPDLDEVLERRGAAIAGMAAAAE